MENDEFVAKCLNMDAQFYGLNICITHHTPCEWGRYHSWNIHHRDGVSIWGCWLLDRIHSTSCDGELFRKSCYLVVATFWGKTHDR